MLKKIIASFVTGLFLCNCIIPSSLCHAQSSLNLPAAGVMLSTSASFIPVYIKGMSVHPENPFQFDFIVNTGDTGMKGDALKAESTKLIKYFLATLTTPEEEMWVNLSPYEKDRIVPEAFGETLMGKDLLAQDYLLKQLSSSLTHPEKALGKDFWDRVYTRAQKEFGTNEIPMSTFNKIWIIPQDVLVYENKNSAFVVHSHLKVMIEEDYVARQKSIGKTSYGLDSLNEKSDEAISKLSSQIAREILVPEVEKEVNSGKTFANLRQIYNSMILATWYKKNLKNSLLGQVYVNQHKNSGVQVDDKTLAQQIYNQYVEAFKKGVYSFIKEDINAATQETTPRKYFSGGLRGVMAGDVDYAQKLTAFDAAGLATDAGKDWNLKIDAVPTDIQEGVASASFVQIQRNINVDFNKVDNAANSSEKERLVTINALLSEIDKEMQKPGSGNLPEIKVISDFHGEVGLFLKYVADAISQHVGKPVSLVPDQMISDQLQKQGINVQDIKFKFNLLGDFLDRGPYGVKTFRVAEELIDLGIAKYVTGNHDLWAFLNLMGYHLPVYKNYNFYGNKEAEQLVKDHWEDEGIVADRLGWWTDKLAEYNVYQKTLQATLFDMGANKLRNSLKEHYLRIKDQLTAEEKELWQDLVGYYFDTTDVATGFNAIGMMSDSWWQARLNKVNAALQQAKNTESFMAVETWETLQEYTQQAADAVRLRLNERLHAGEWWFTVFDAINSQNYTSVEWWGKDWSSHNGWGTAVIKELNEKAGREKWNQANYIHNRDLKDLAIFYRKHFNLFLKDEYGNVYTHGWLPVDEITGKVTFSYKGVTYSGKDVWQGLEAIQNDVHNLQTPLAELHEALSLVNSWYADKTTKIKPENIKFNVERIGFEKIYSDLGIRTWVTVHNTLNKLLPKGIGFKVLQGPYAHFSVDKGLSWEKFNDVGGYGSVGRDGIHLRGFSGPDFKEIVDNPDTLLLSKDKEGARFVKTSWPTEPMLAKDFLVQMSSQLKDEKAYLEGWLTAQDTLRIRAWGGNWKMNVLDIDQMGQRLFEVSKAIADGSLDPNKVDIFFAPSSLDVEAFIRLRDSMVEQGSLPEGAVKVAVQGISTDEKGARTSENSIKSIERLGPNGVSYVILGHSEMRQYWGVTDEMVNKQWKLVIKYNKTPVFCVGETLQEREQGKLYDVVRSQVLTSLDGISAKELLDSNAIVAYEPVWAIGTGKTATTEQAVEMVSFILRLVYDKYGVEVASKIRIQYGGSMKLSNAASLISKPYMGGGLIGGASEGKDAVEIMKIFSANADATVDQAQNSWTRGGINLDPAMLNMEIKKDAQGGFLPAKDQPIFNVNIQGLVPVIMKMEPATGMMRILSKTNEEVPIGRS